MGVPVGGIPISSFCAVSCWERARQHDVLRLQVEVDDSLLVDELDPLEDLDGEVSALGLRQDVGGRRNPLKQLSAGEVLGQDDGLEVTLVVVEELDDVFVLLLQPGQDVDLSPNLLIVLVEEAPLLVLGRSRLLGCLALEQVDLAEASKPEPFDHLEQLIGSIRVNHLLGLYCQRASPI